MASLFSDSQISNRQLLSSAFGFLPANHLHLEGVGMNVVVKTPQPLRQRLSPDEWRRMAAMFGLILFLHVAGALLM